ncbi:probable enoyl-CoA hydratase, mitochondrial [Fopius arisanus]|uniref:CaiD protein n=1 Tax=Fopius arisanus TaxID=64838 RepID=A0A0C9QHP4_9HYME|nr:PREDICTED: probable enoyl-CoA hydratase, mitochondrial [Fopius arisanus]
MFPTNRLLLSLRKTAQSYLKRGITSKTAVTPEPNEESDTVVKNIVVSQTGPIRLFGLSRPQRKNALDSATAQELAEALDEFDENEEMKIGIVHGIGGNFCSGFDLGEIAKSEGDSDRLPHFGALCTRMQLSKKPLIAAVTGYAIGAGFELALMCDLRILEQKSRMGFLNRRFGIPVMCGGTVRLPAMVGYSRAMDLILTGREISGEEAFNWGLGARLVASGSALGQSISIAQSILKYPQGALLADRTSMSYATFGGKPIEEALEFERDNATDLLLDGGIKGAQRFVDGFGRHGKSTNITTNDRTSFRSLEDDVL